MDGNNENKHALDLVKRIRHGDRKAFKELYDTYKDRIFSTAVRMLGNKQDAEDAAQEVFVKVYKNIDSFRGDSAFFTWIYRITMNTCIEVQRKKARQGPHDSIDDYEYLLASSDKLPSAGSFQMILDKEINKLPDGYKRVFVMYAVEGFKHKEIAKILGVSTGTSKSQYFQARTHLRKQLLPYLEVLKNEL